jgi:hypothetical protein
LIDKNNLLKITFQQDRQMSCYDLFRDFHLSDSMKIVQGWKWRLDITRFCEADTQEVAGNIRLSWMKSACG